VAVPAPVSEETFALAQGQLPRNKHHSPRRTVEATLLQGMWYASTSTPVAPKTKNPSAGCVEDIFTSHDLNREA
jgi:hypothetical protein